MFGRRSRRAVVPAPNSGTAAARGSPLLVQCPLCGLRFDRARGAACAHCPKLFRSCGMVVCPRCSHEFPVL